MQQSPLKQLGGPRREKYAPPDGYFSDADVDRRRRRGEQPKARKFHLDEEAPRGERGRQQHPRG